METIDYIVLVGYFLMLIVIGFIGYLKVKSSADFYTAGGKLPWWLSGISHHVSGYSGAVFVAYAGVAYTHGFTLYIWWALGIASAMVLTTFLIAPRWARLRASTGVQSPTEYLKTRYNLPTQQVMAWCGVIIKLFDVGAKWAAIGVLLNAFTGIPFVYGIAISGLLTLVYIVLGGLWADVWNDFASFFVQLAGGIAMFVMVLNRLGDGAEGFFTVWEKLPPDHSKIFNEPYTPLFVFTMMFISFFSYSGGTWNLATRFMSTSSGSNARKASLLSACLYLLWPLVLFFPMFAAPLFFDNLADPTQSYSMMVMKFLPPGLVGLVLASIFANTLTMTASDSNTISAVITRDILPNLNKTIRSFDTKRMLLIARITTLTFISVTIIIAMQSSSFGGVFGLIVSWFAALIGPISIPMILGLLPAFKHSGSVAAVVSIVAGLLTFIALKLYGGASLGIEVGAPVFASFILFTGFGLFSRKKVRPEVEQMLSSLNHDK